MIEIMEKIFDIGTFLEKGICKITLRQAFFSF